MAMIYISVKALSRPRIARQHVSHAVAGKQLRLRHTGFPLGKDDQNSNSRRMDPPYRTRSNGKTRRSQLNCGVSCLH